MSVDAGATNWPSPAYSPERKVYLIAQEGCGITYRSTTNSSGQAQRNCLYGKCGCTGKLAIICARPRCLTGKKIWDFEQSVPTTMAPDCSHRRRNHFRAGTQGSLPRSMQNREAALDFNTGALITAAPSHTWSTASLCRLGVVLNIFAFALPDAR